MESIEVVPEIYKIELPIVRGYVNSYLIKGNEGWLLIDAGWNDQDNYEIFVKTLEKIGISFKDIDQIIITHAHPDHYGLAEKIKRLSGAKLAIHQKEKFLISQRYVEPYPALIEMKESFRMSGMTEDELSNLEESVEYRKPISPAFPDITFAGGEKITWKPFNFEVIWTPGHSQGHICLYEAERRILLSGDQILPTITTHIGSFFHKGENPLSEYLESLQSLKTLDVAIVLPGHEYPFRNFKERIQEIIHHHELRNRNILSIIQEGKRTALEVSQNITWMANGENTSWYELDAMDKELSVMETLVHLEYLKGEKRIRRTIRNGVAFYEIE